MRVGNPVGEKYGELFENENEMIEMDAGIFQ